MSRFSFHKHDKKQTIFIPCLSSIVGASPSSLLHCLTLVMAFSPFCFPDVIETDILQSQNFRRVECPSPKELLFIHQSMLSFFFHKGYLSFFFTPILWHPTWGYNKLLYPLSQLNCFGKLLWFLMSLSRQVVDELGNLDIPDFITILLKQHYCIHFIIHN